MIENIQFPLSDETRGEVLEEQKRLQRTNSVLVGDLAQYGQINFESVMLDTYFDAMVEMGLIDADQLSVIRLTWEQRFNAHLRKTMKEVKEQVAQMERIQQLGGNLQKKPGLIVPGR